MNDAAVLPSAEGTIAVPGGNIWFSRVGNPEKTPLLVAHGGPGFPHNYLLSLKELADEREVIFWDQLGCGRSEQPADTSLWTLERSLEEVDAVVEGLALDRFHLFGNSWGGMLGQQYLLDRQTDIASFTISNSIASIPQLASDTERLKKLLPADVQEAIDRNEEAGTFDDPSYEAAIKVWFDRYVCRVSPWPEELEHSYANFGTEIYLETIGPSEFHITGNLKAWNVFERLPEISTPTLLVAGKYDECSPEHMFDMHKQIPGSEYVLFEESAHMPFIEQSELFMSTVRTFLGRHDS